MEEVLCGSLRCPPVTAPLDHWLRIMVSGCGISSFNQAIRIALGTQEPARREHPQVINRSS